MVTVAPRAGAWIETIAFNFNVRIETFLDYRVAPRAGAWIETADIIFRKARTSARRPPCGGVD